MIQLMDAELSLTAYFIVFAAGLTSGLSPCTLPTILLIVGYVGGREQWSGWRAFYQSLSFVAGLVFSLAILGTFASLLGSLFLGSKVIWYVVSLILVVMGLYQLEYFRFNLNFAPRVNITKNAGLLGSFLLGLPFGLMSSPCTTPATAAVLAFAAAKGSPAAGALLLGVFAFGLSIPLLLAGTFTGWIKNTEKLAAWSDMIKKISGYIMIGVALYFLWATR